MGGEEGLLSLILASRLGLPPRGRGRVSVIRVLLSRRGITPAWAGKRAGRARGRPGRRDYPRVGGEETGVQDFMNAKKGLPPRGRGRGPRGGSIGRTGRITPAWAGKSWGRTSRSSRRTDYPRVGGEEGTPRGRWHAGSGLPPRGRGREPDGHKSWYRARITPAWAGKRSGWILLPVQSWDYPRVGGEELHPGCGLRIGLGLPPRGRGRVLCA